MNYASLEPKDSTTTIDHSVDMKISHQYYSREITYYTSVNNISIPFRSPFISLINMTAKSRGSGSKLTTSQSMNVRESGKGMK